MITYEEARKKAGISDSKTMARMMKMSPQLYSMKENYRRHFKAFEFVEFCRITGSKPEDLITSGY